jgi:hypothetical protein
MKITYIYTLSHPITNEIRYVGKTVRPKRRFNEHCSINICSKRKNHKNNWCLKLLKNGLKPKINFIDKTLENWQELEQKWIKHFKELSCNLLNETNGGEGQEGRKLTEEHKKKISLGNKKTNASLTVKQVVLICKMINEGAKYNDVKSKIPFLNESSYYGIKSGRIWKDVTFGLIKYQPKNYCNKKYN